ncbi:hypothetical protein B0J11DRAFT_614132 [Dendryphion nanum]|uniref:Uncharacterized protein n=1 Tax=Dendryphion nanum TaxID=256645 RepID=A0A9P9ILH8_9PLEO|nr:hypothetical protein B0J11DRAFT_614132 [Dendryphion nanum]
MADSLEENNQSSTSTTSLATPPKIIDPWIIPFIKRKDMSSTREEFDEEKDKKGQAYRMGWPNLPPLLCHTITDGVSQHIEDRRHRLNSVRQILRTEGFDAQMDDCYDPNVFFAFRAPRTIQGEDVDSRDYLTLVISLPDMDTYRDRIDNVLYRLRVELRQHESTQSVMIEFIEREALAGGYVDVIKSKEHKDAFDHHYSELKKLLGDASWSTMETYRVSVKHSESTARPTFIICSRNAGDPRWWTETLPKARNWMSTQDVKFDIELFGAPPGGILF